MGASKSIFHYARNRLNRFYSSVALPDFRNLGVMLRVLLVAEGLRLLAAYLEGGDLAGVYGQVMANSGLFEPVLLIVMLALFLLSRLLLARPYHQGVLLVLVVSVSSTIGWVTILRWGGQGAGLPGNTYIVVSVILLTMAIVAYFNWRYRVLSPALSEARLIALQARIRPHFLFNSLNTVLGLIRTEPKRAETILENLADLFRALMSEPSNLVPLAKELELARAYAEIEMARLGKRLVVDWQCQGAPDDAMVPPLILQPLLENAVYHGVEPAASGGTVSVTVFLKGQELNLVVRNPCQAHRERRSGNRIALNNIRERLDLHFDAEAAMRTYEAGEEFVVQIRMPYRRAVG